MLKNIFIAIVVVVLLGIWFSVYTVHQTQKAIVLRLGKIEMLANKQPNIVGPGLHFKIPLVETVNRFDMRLRTLNVDSSRIMTAEQKEVLVDAYVKWRISNIVTYYKATNDNEARARQLLMQKVNDGLRDEFGRQTIIELLSEKRLDAMKRILAGVRAAAEPLGIDVVDVRVKRLDLPTEIENRIFARMRSAREKDAATIRADGQQQAEVIMAQAKADVAVTLSQARSQAAQIKAEGDAQAAQIYATAYNQSPNFYEFLRSLDAYQAVFGQTHQTMVLNPQGEFFKAFSSPDLLSQVAQK